MELFTDPLVDGWEFQNVLWEVALKEGYSLTSTVIQEIETQRNAVWRVTDRDKGQSFLLCLDDTLNLTFLNGLALTKDSLFVCRDSALDDTTAANLALQCRLKTV